MKFDVPVYIRETRDFDTQALAYEVSPLFVDGPVQRNTRLSRAITKLARDVRIILYRTMLHGDSAAAAPWSFSPDLEEHRYQLPIELRRRTVRCVMLVVAFRALDRRVAFSPGLPELWFEVPKGKALRERSIEVYTHHFREEEKKHHGEINPEEHSLAGKAWTTTLDLEVPAAAPRQKRRAGAKFASFGQAEEFLSGALHLHSVGESLDSLYPDELGRAILRENQVKELTGLLDGRDKRPVLLVGPRKSGKTAIIHEYVYRKVDRRTGKRRYAMRNNTWLLSPQRLVSGMSIVGQWEQRLLAIIREAKRRNHILYFDDLPGLYLAGMSAGSDLSMAQVMKPFIERRDFRLLAEMTPESLRVLQEKDRGFADLFHVIHIREADEGETLRIMITAMRQLEEQHRCRFGLDVLPTVMELQRRYIHDTVFPGKAADFCRQLATRLPRQAIWRSNVLAEFEAQSGLRTEFFDGERKLPRQFITAGIQKNVVGQLMAVEAITDTICRAKARLNDPERPLGAFLFLGPTGVGKTQCAKATASYLFEAPDHMIRLDMNEFVDAESVPRLIGTFREPEGLLTSAVRRRPFCVLLLDEIEKAHPDVFDLLLQVLGEGRLTDSVGRTTDFTNAIIIMTSNLGAREVRSQLGFHEAGDRDTAVYVDAARKFFRPEFFNRIDRVVPFTALSREEIERISRGLIANVLKRHGLQQRRCILRVAGNAMDKVVDAGYHPQLGARALKRVIESDLAQPVATRLAALAPGTPTVISVYAGPSGIAVRTQGLVNAERVPPPQIFEREPDDILARTRRALARLEPRLEALQPREPVGSGGVKPEHERYYAIREHVRYLEIHANRLQEQLDRPPRRARAGAVWRPRGRGRLKRYYWMDTPLRELLAAKDLVECLEEMDKEADVPASAARTAAGRLIWDTILYETMLGGRDGEPVDRALVWWFCTDDHEGPSRWELSNMYRELCRRLGSGYAFERFDDDDPWPVPDDMFGCVVEGPNAAGLMSVEQGTHLFKWGGQVVAGMLHVAPVAEGDDPREVAAAQETARREWLEQLRTGDAAEKDDPFGVDEVIRLYELRGMTVDFRTGNAVRGEPGGHDTRRFVLSRLPLPEEFE